MPKQKRESVKRGLSTVSLIIGIISLLLTYTGVVGGYDTEPLLAIAIILLAIAMIKK